MKLRAIEYQVERKIWRSQHMDPINSGEIVFTFSVAAGEAMKSVSLRLGVDDNNVFLWTTWLLLLLLLLITSEIEMKRNYER